MPTETVFFEKAFVNGIWQDNCLLTVKDHQITDIQHGMEQRPGNAKRLSGYALPGLVNVHSHAFQRAFAGLSEFRTSENDSFWTWRNLMYDFLKRVEPEEAYKIAFDLYRDMARSGYSAVGEFHYLHHQVDGTPYKKTTAMADTVIQAAIDAGIGICILPVLYQRGGFDGRDLAGGQLRFGSSNDLFVGMIQQLNEDWGSNHRVNIGVSIHSLRAVSIENARTVLKEVESIVPGCPIHIHIAEQTAEVEECLGATGKRPVELLLDSFEVDSRWCLVHATHLNDQEVVRMANSGAIAGLCPTTEANLGDGVFRGEDYMNSRGRIAVGSDSHISVSMCSELRTLEYSQRLLHRKRAILCNEEKSCGNLLYDEASKGGAMVTGFGSGSIHPGDPASFLVLDETHPFFKNYESERWLDYLVFSEQPAPFPGKLVNL